MSVQACTARDLALGIAVSQNMKVSLLQGKRARYLGPPRLGELIYFVEKQSVSCMQIARTCLIAVSGS